MRRIALQPLCVLFALLLALVARGAVAEESEPAAASDDERAEIRRLVDEMRAEAARLRGLAWKHDVPADLLTRDQLRANMAKNIQEEMEPVKYERDLAIARRLGILKPDEDPIQMYLAMLKELVGGYYDPETKHLYLIQGMTGEAQKPVILHELIHALEDQHMDLKFRTERIEEDFDRLFVEKCLQEGSAEHASQIFQRENPEIAKKYQQEQAKPETAAAQVRVLTQMPASLVIGTLLWYQIGPSFVARSVGDDYVNGIARLYAYPPVSQEQLLHPEKWFSEKQDFPQQIAFEGDLASVAGEGWSLLHESASGELDIALYLDHHLGPTKGRTNVMLVMAGKYAVDVATTAAAGWDGARTAFLKKEGLPLAWIQAAVFDTGKDAEEAADAIAKALKNASQLGEIAWREVEVEGGETEHVFDFEGAYGLGRLLRRGDKVFLVEGVPAETFEAVWTKTLSAKFTKDLRDTWDPAEAANRLAVCDFVDEGRGIGLVLPDESWELDETGGRPGFVAALEKGEVRAEVVALDVPVPLAMALPMIEAQLRPAFPEAKMDAKVPATVAGGTGWLYDLGRGPEDGEGARTWLFLGGEGGRVFVVRASGPAEAVQGELAALKKAVAGIVSQKP